MELLTTWQRNLGPAGISNWLWVLLLTVTHRFHFLHLTWWRLTHINNNWEFSSLAVSSTGTNVLWVPYYSCAAVVLTKLRPVRESLSWTTLTPLHTYPTQFKWPMQSMLSCVCWHVQAHVQMYVARYKRAQKSYFASNYLSAAHYNPLPNFAPYPLQIPNERPKKTSRSEKYHLLTCCICQSVHHL